MFMFLAMEFSGVTKHPSPQICSKDVLSVDTMDLLCSRGKKSSGRSDEVRAGPELRVSQGSLQK